MTTGRQVLLRHTTERNFAAWVFREAAREGWCGFSILRSEAVVTGVHTLHNSDHRDSHGWPDCVFWKPGGPILYRELKVVEGRVAPDQKRCLADLGGDVWRPSDEDLIRRTFRETGS